MCFLGFWVLVFCVTRSVAAPMDVDCLIEPNQMVELASPVIGLVEQVLVKRGDLVRKGQLIARLASQAEQASVDLARYKSEQVGLLKLAESKTEFSKKKFERKRTMMNEKLLSTQESDDAEAEYKQAVSELQVARENRQIAQIDMRQQLALLKYRSIYSPFDGVVVEQLAYPGEVIEPSGNKKVIVKVAEINILKIRSILPKNYFLKVKVGSVVKVVPEISSLGGFVAVVKSVDKIVDAASGSFVVISEMKNKNLTIPSGLKCRASFNGA